MLVVDGEEIEEGEKVNLPFRNIGECVVKSSVVVYLYISFNQLTSFKTKDLPNLEELYLTGNKLVSFEAKNLPNLRGLWLSDNQLVSFEANDLPNLQRLYLYNNQLTSFEAIDLPNLQGLSLTNNQLTSLDTTGLPNLRELYLSRNQLTSFEAKNLPNLRELSLSNNQLVSFTGNFPNIQELWLAHNPSFVVLRLTLAQTPKLQELNLEGTNVKFVDPSLVHLVKGSIPRAHFIGTVELLEEAFVTKGHPILEEISEHIEV
jgi:Leucine-rich repeat (LRR) protein